MLASLVAMNYHFVGDVVAGTAVGAGIGMCAVGLRPYVLGEAGRWGGSLDGPVSAS